MTDIVDYIRTRLSEQDQPLTADAVNTALLDARIQYGGEILYVRKPKMRELIRDSRRSVSRRTRF